jgi:hypothetical protein
LERGETYPDLKWNWEKLARCPDASAVVARLRVCREDLTTSELLEPSVVDRVEGHLRLLGLPYSLERDQPKVRRPHRSSMWRHHDRWLLLLDDTLFQVSPSVVLLLSTCREAVTVGDLVRSLTARFDGSKARTEADVCTALSQLLALHLLEVDPVQDLPNAIEPLQDSIEACADELSGETLFQPIVGSGASARAYLRREATIWRHWVEILALKDDLRGALNAGQIGAALAAGRALVQRTLLVKLALLGSEATSEELAEIGLRCGEESHIYRAAWRLLQHNALGGTDIKEYAAHLGEFCADVLADPHVLLAGSFREDSEHRMLFRSLYELVLMSQATRVSLPIEQAFISRSAALAKGCSGDPQ